MLVDRVNGQRVLDQILATARGGLGIALVLRALGAEGGVDLNGQTSSEEVVSSWTAMGA